MRPLLLGSLLLLSRPPFDPGASPVRPDVSICIAGAKGTQPVLAKWNELFMREHPGSKITASLNGPSAAIAALTAGVAQLALLDREARPLEIRPFRQLHGYEPLDVHIGRAGYVAAGRANPPAVYVNANNPLDGLNLEQLARIFVRGAGNGDLTHWSQLGLDGPWSDRAIHLYGPRDDGGFATSIRHQYMRELPFARSYEPLPRSAAILSAVAEDRYGIALLDRIDSRIIPGSVRMLPLSNGSKLPYSAGAYSDVFAGLYPLSPYLHLYANTAPGHPLDSDVRDYVQLVLSPQGQAIIANQKDSQEGLVPLQLPEIHRELSKLP